jgi:lysyl-tRNA synthetase class 2
MIEVLRPAPARGPGATLPLLAGVATAAVGAVNIVSALLPAAQGRLAVLLTIASHAELAAARSIALPLGLALLIAVDLAKGLDVEEAALTWVVAWTLWRARGHFPVLAPRRLPVRWLALAGAALAGLALTALLPSSDGAIAASFAAAAALAVGAERTRVAGLGDADDLDRRDAATLVRAYGTDTLSAFKLRRDLQRRVHAGGRVLVGQRVQAGALLVAGDPVGAGEHLAGALAAARAEARAHGLAFGVVGASERCAEAGRALGLRRLYLGDEAMIATGPMDLAGGRRKSLRKAVNRVARDYTAQLCRAGDLDPATVAQLRDVDAAWRAGAPDRGFSMAADALADELLPDALVVLARHRDGGVGGFLHFVPVFGRPQASLGRMCRDRATPNGLTEFLVVRAAELLAAEGITEFSLNFAAFGRWLRAPANPAERVLARLLRVGDRWFQIERLEHFTAKFDPRWQPRYLLFDGALTMPRVALAALAVEGHLPAPRRAPAVDLPLAGGTVPAAGA